MKLREPVLYINRAIGSVLLRGLNSKPTEHSALHSLASILPYYITLSKGTPPGELGLGKGHRAFVQCLDPCKYTGGGTVTFKITRENS